MINSGDASTDIYLPEANGFLDPYIARTPQLDRSYALVRGFRKASFLISCVVITAGAINIIDWATETFYLSSNIPDMKMPVSISICLLLCGISLLYHLFGMKRQDHLAIGKLSALISAAVAVMILGGYTGIWALDFDQLFYRTTLLPMNEIAPGRMAPNTAFCLFLASIALFGIDAELRRGHRPAQYLAGLSLFLALTALVGYAFGVPSLTGIYQYSVMALPVAALVAIICLGILFARPDRGLMSVITNPGAGGIMARHLLPAALGLPIVLGGLRKVGEHLGWFPADFGSVLLVMLMIPAMFWVIWGTSYQLGRMDTARRLAGEALRDSAERTRSIIDRAYDAFIAIDLSGRITDWNKQAEITFGWKREEILGKTLDETIIPAEYREAHLAGLQRYKHTHEGPLLNKRIEVRALHRDGHEFTIELALFPMGTNENITVCAFLHDISSRKAHEEEVDCLNKALLEQITDAATKNESLQHLTEEMGIARDQAVDLARLKSEFIASVSHEIRTPLSSIIGMTELLLDTALDKDQERITSTIYSSGTNLLAIVNDILDFAKMDARKVELHPGEFSLVALMEEVGQLLATQARSKQLSLFTYVDPQLPDELFGDVRRLRQILINLSGNAVKFTESGHVAIYAEPVFIGESETKIKFRVTDTGPGISETAMHHLFKPFSQAPSKRHYTGTGLGLSICKNLVELMNGEIAVESKLGEGSTFWFSVTLERQNATADEVTSVPQRLRGHRLVLLSQDATLQDIIMRTVSAMGGACEIYGSHEDAYKAVFRLNSAAHGAFMVDTAWGHDKAKDFVSILQDEPQLHGLNLIALTADETRTAVNELIDSGASCVLFKPFARNDLIAAIQGHLVLPNLNTLSEEQYAEASALELGAEPGARTTDKVVLLAEDNPALRELAFRQLKKLGYQIHCVSDGAEALKAIQAQPYSLILMDCQMPNMDGFEATRHIRKLECESKKHTPIVALTASVLPEDKDKCFAAGMDEFLMKPVVLDDIRELLKRWIGLPAPVSASVTEPSSSETSANEKRAVEQKVSSVEDPVDVNWLTEQYGEESIAEILQTFRDETRNLVTRLKSAATSGSAAEEAAIAHQLAGIAAVVGALEMKRLSQILERAVRDKDQASAAQTLEDLFGSIEIVQRWIITQTPTNGGNSGSHI